MSSTPEKDQDEQYVAALRERGVTGAEPSAAVGLMDAGGESTAARVAAMHRERLRLLGEMTSGVVHDLGNMMQAIRLRVALLRGDPACMAAQGSNIETLARVADDAMATLRRLREFSQRREDEDVLVDVGAALRDSCAMVRGEIEAEDRAPARVAIKHVPALLPPVRANAAELRHVFVNLLLNARDAMPAGGTIRVEARAEDGRVVVQVLDEGTGIPEPLLARIFEPFFTTKPSGTGLGLSLARAVMERLGGRITAHNRHGRGAVLTLELPEAELEDGLSRR